MLNLSVVTPPSTETVTFAEMQAHLRAGTEEQTLIESLTTAARDWCELVARRSFVTQTFQVTTDGWPGVGYRLPFAPLISVDHVKYYTTDNVLRTLSASVYQVETSCNPGQVILAFNQVWPGDALRPGYPIVIQYQAGYGAAANVPQRYKQAIKLLTAHWFENREAMLVGSGIGSVKLQLALESLLLIDRGGYVNFCKN